jgi:hypothetical protein
MMNDDQEFHGRENVNIDEPEVTWHNGVKRISKNKGGNMGGGFGVLGQ